ncbi:alpha/beta hydrolase [Lysobacter sp. LF1]|uniref:Alpha/beta hydrolase n=1 Tax=Lysobacter stagni TaxID=3045172 RepID=A0ABT6XCU7_9GAMM|nr:alpha/beta hydrolase [Lysobacter sp. LF1]MDI9237968.1 alpha/beta hydrolase [Lysobacter sp. LF1]
MRTLHYGPSADQVGDFHASSASDAPVVVLLHGGFWRMPYGRDEMTPVAQDLVQRGFAVWNVEYRRVGAEGGGWPGTLEDVARAIDHLATIAGDGASIDLQRVAVVGHSAGGHLALCASARRRVPGHAFSTRRVTPFAAASLAGVVDLDAAHALDAGNSAVHALLGGTPTEVPSRYDETSPMRLLPLGVRQLVMHGSDDPALPARLSRRYAEAAIEHGDAVEHVEIEGMGHMEYLDPASVAHAVLCEWLVSTLMT